MNALLTKSNGFTLIELLVVIAIVGVVMTVTTSLFINGYNFYLQNKEQTEIQKELRFLTNYIDENIKYSKQVTLHNSKPSLGSDEATIGFKNSHIIFDSDTSSEKNLTSIEIDNFELEAYQTDSNILSLLIKKNNYQLKTEILLNNFNFSGKPSGTYLKFKKQDS